VSIYEFPLIFSLQVGGGLVQCDVGSWALF